MTFLHISDTHGFHRKLTDLPKADVIVHSGDFTDFGTEDEVLDFLNWFILLPYKHKIFVTGNHDLCLWDATGIEDLPENVHFFQDCGCEIDGLFGHAHESNGLLRQYGIVFSNAAVLDDHYRFKGKPRLIDFGK